jgi:hypothetical protein
MKTVGIITFHFIYNFGAVLQAYALRRVVIKLGYRSELIDFQPISLTRPKQLFIISRRVRGWVRNLRTLLRLKEHLLLRKRFCLFLREQMGLGECRPIKNYQDLSSRIQKYSSYVSGSDMIWNPSFLDSCYAMCGRAYYLDFVKDGQARMVAYASSFGVTKIPTIHRPLISSLLSRYHCLSSREERGCELIHEVSQRVAEHVLDPTLLLTAREYDEIALHPDWQGSFILLYPMEPSDIFCSLAKRVSELLKLPVVAVVPYGSDPDKFAFADRVVYDSGPAEFLGWMKAASFVCTNSYHGTCFALVYRKTFLGVPDTVSNMRSFDLLNRLGLTRRQLTNPNNLELEDPLLAPIDYAVIEPKLKLAIDNSLNYLQAALA